MKNLVLNVSVKMKQIYSDPIVKCYINFFIMELHLVIHFNVFLSIPLLFIFFQRKLAGIHKKYPTGVYTMKTGVIGLGAMGANMARNLAKADHLETVYNQKLSTAEVIAKHYEN